MRVALHFWALGKSDRSALRYCVVTNPDEAALIVIRLYMSPPADPGWID